MSILTDKTKCTGCSCCAGICPGNLICMDDSGKAYLRRPFDCWSCMACIKECPVGAISFVLSPEMGGKSGQIFVNRDSHRTEWIIDRTDGPSIAIITDTREANSY